MTNMYEQIVRFDPQVNNLFGGLSRAREVKNIAERSAFLMRRIKVLAFSPLFDLVNMTMAFSVDLSHPTDIMKDVIKITSNKTMSTVFMIHVRGPRVGVYTPDDGFRESVARDQHGRDNWTTIERYFL